MDALSAISVVVGQVWWWEREMLGKVFWLTG
jgi:hypothetical protein